MPALAVLMRGATDGAIQQEVAQLLVKLLQQGTEVAVQVIGQG